MDICLLQHYSHGQKTENVSTYQLVPTPFISLISQSLKTITLIYFCMNEIKYYLALKKENPASMTIWMNLKDIKVNEISQIQKDKYSKT